MQFPGKKPFWILSILTGVFVLVACSPSQGVQSPLPVEATQVLLPGETPTAEISTSPSSVFTETAAALPIETAVEVEPAIPTATLTVERGKSILADVLSVVVSGDEKAYQFAVEIGSPDTGCEQYANWWEVVSQDGELLYRRILAHSHVNEQPFTRSGGTVVIDPDTIVIVRAHMYPDGYGGAAFRGSVEGGFEAIQLAPDFAAGLEDADPQPDGCGF